MASEMPPIPIPGKPMTIVCDGESWGLDEHTAGREVLGINRYCLRFLRAARDRLQA